MIGRMRANRMFDRNWLKGELGDALPAVICGAGRNLQMILTRLRALYCALIAMLAMQAHECGGLCADNEHRTDPAA